MPNWINTDRNSLWAKGAADARNGIRARHMDQSYRNGYTYAMNNQLDPLSRAVRDLDEELAKYGSPKGVFDKWRQLKQVLGK